jgi:hypothetical protein
MTPEKVFHEFLGLGLNWEVTESRFERETTCPLGDNLEVGVCFTSLTLHRLAQRSAPGYNAQHVG